MFPIISNDLLFRSGEPLRSEDYLTSRYVCPETKAEAYFTFKDTMLSKKSATRNNTRSFLPAAKPTGHRTVRVVVVVVLVVGGGLL